MATFKRIKYKKQSGGGALHGVLEYVLRPDKCVWNGRLVASGQDCCPQTAFQEMMTTKRNYRKTDGVIFFHYVQSFHKDEKITPEQANQIGLELAKQFEGYEVLVATHTDTDEIHNHFIVNSVSHKTGAKLHQSPTSLSEHRKKNDEICRAHGLATLNEYTDQMRTKGMNAGEYRSATRGDSWKFALIKAIEDALRYSRTKEDFIQNMEYEGYEVSWRDDRKYITYTCPNGMKCRDNKLHDETYLKENLEKLFAYRAIHGFTPQTEEPETGWLSLIYPTKLPANSIAEDVIRLGKNIEGMGDTPPPATPYIHTDSKQKHRERLKKLAQGHKLQSEEQEQGQGLGE